MMEVAASDIASRDAIDHSRMTCSLMYRGLPFTYLTTFPAPIVVGALHAMPSDVHASEMGVPVPVDELVPARPGQAETDVTQAMCAYIALPQRAPALGRVPVPVTPPSAGDPFGWPHGELEVLPHDHPAGSDVTGLNARL